MEIEKQNAERDKIEAGKKAGQESLKKLHAFLDRD